MSNRDDAIALHKDLADCWTNRCFRASAGARHLRRAEELASGAELTAHEKALDRTGVMEATWTM